jgi:hypothetical protein
VPVLLGQGDIKLGWGVVKQNTLRPHWQQNKRQDIPQDGVVGQVKKIV